MSLTSCHLFGMFQGGYAYLQTNQKLILAGSASHPIYFYWRASNAQVAVPETHALVEMALRDHMHVDMKGEMPAFVNLQQGSIIATCTVVYHWAEGIQSLAVVRSKPVFSPSLWPSFYLSLSLSLSDSPLHLFLSLIPSRNVLLSLSLSQLPTSIDPTWTYWNALELSRVKTKDFLGDKAKGKADGGSSQPTSPSHAVRTCIRKRKTKSHLQCSLTSDLATYATRGLHGCPRACWSFGIAARLMQCVDLMSNNASVEATLANLKPVFWGRLELHHPVSRW